MFEEKRKLNRAIVIIIVGVVVVLVENTVKVFVFVR